MTPDAEPVHSPVICVEARSHCPSRLERWLTLLALWGIRAYQRNISPHKGFACAYRVQVGAASCSTLGYRAIRRFGLRRGWTVLQQRLTRCGLAHRRQQPKTGGLSPQAGLCDLGCDMPCDPSCDGHGSGGWGRWLSNVCSPGDFCNLCDCGDWSRRRKRASDEKRYVYVPPARFKATEQEPAPTSLGMVEAFEPGSLPQREQPDFDARDDMHPLHVTLQADAPGLSPPPPR